MGGEAARGGPLGAWDCEAGPLSLTSPSSPPVLTLSSTRMGNSTWTNPWMSPGTWKNSCAARWTVWTPDSPHLPVCSPLPEARSPEWLDPTLLFGNSTPSEVFMFIVILVLLCILTPLQGARVAVHTCVSLCRTSACLAFPVLGAWPPPPGGLCLLYKGLSCFCHVRYAVQADL